MNIRSDSKISKERLVVVTLLFLHSLYFFSIELQVDAAYIVNNILSQFGPNCPNNHIEIVVFLSGYLVCDNSSVIRRA